MDDLYRKYAVPPSEIGSIPRSSFPGYFSTEASSLTSQHLQISNDLWGASTEYVQKDVLPLHPGAYSGDDGIGVGARRDPGFDGLPAGASVTVYPSLEDPHVGQRQDVAVGITPGTLDIKNERPGSLGKANGLPVVTGESNILFVDGLPTDCTRREVGHLFRPFIGFKEIRVVHKEPRRSGDKARVLCFVEFDDARCALTALEALQGYKFDDKKPESPVLRIHFAHFPFRLPSDRDDQRF